MRKLAAAILAAVMAFSIAACSGGDEQSTPSSAIESTTPTPAVSSTPHPDRDARADPDCDARAVQSKPAYRA